MPYFYMLITILVFSPAWCFGASSDWNEMIWSKDKWYSPNAVQPCTYTISPQSKTFLSSGGTGLVTVTASAENCGWTVSGNPSWISVSPTSGTSSRQVTIMVSANTGADERTASVTIAGKTYAVHQSATACSFSLSTSNGNFNQTGGTRTVSVVASDSNCSWTVSESLPWVTVYPINATGSQSVAVSVDVNNDGNDRAGTITIADNFYTISQESQPTWYADVDSDGYGNSGITVTSGDQPIGYVSNGTDCDDTDSSIFPGATEKCGDGIDQDCDGSDQLCGAVQEITIISPVNQNVAGFGASGGKISFMFSKISTAVRYVLYFNLYDILNAVSIPIPLDLIPTTTSSDLWGGTTTGTPGFSESVMGMTYDLQLDAFTWDVLSLYDIDWGVEAYDQSGTLVGSTFSGGSPDKTCNRFRLIGSNTIVLQEPDPGKVLSKIDPAPFFKWELYPNAATYTLLLARVGGLGFDVLITKDSLTLNLLTMDDNTWQTMPAGSWYWTVLGYDGTGVQTPGSFTIFDFTVQ